MYELKGFFSMPALADNTANEAIARFGELSTYGKTFTKDQKNFSKPSSYPNVELITLKIVNEIKQSVTPSNTFIDNLLALGNWLYVQHIGGDIPVNANKGAFITSIQSEFPMFSNIQIGELMSGTQPNRNMPDFISFRADDGSGKSYSIRIWVSDARMRTQNDDRLIYVVPPTDNIDDLDSNIAAVGTLLSSVTPGDIMNRVSNVIGTFPPTRQRVVSLTWRDPNNVGLTTTTDFYLVIYGQAGDDLDAQYNAIRDYLANNSSGTRWNIIYPQLFSDNEFTVIPLWDKVALPDNAAVIGLFSSSVEVGELRTIAVERLPVGYGQTTNLSTYLDANLSVNSSFYRSLMFLAVGNPSNMAGIYKLRQKYPDYTHQPTNQPDFLRMSQETQDFVIKLSECLEKARTMMPNDIAPTGFGKVVRGSRLYLTFSIHGHTWLVLTKDSYAIG